MQAEVRRQVLLSFPPGSSKARTTLHDLTEGLVSISALGPTARSVEVDVLRKEFIATIGTRPAEARPRLEAAGRVLCDLAAQGWSLEYSEAGVLVLAPSEEAAAADEKERVRQQELLKRNEQLAQTSVQRFLRRMETKHLHAGAQVSVFELMRNGPDLEAQLRAAAGDKDQLKDVIRPYIQPVTAGETCEHTGLLLNDIWRYFRHTWSNQYTSVPGRQMLLLIRDSAAPFHPVIGIAALGSSIVQIGVRDQWIGWDTQQVLAEIQAKPTAAHEKWLHQVLADWTSEIYLDDLLEEDLVTRETLQNPTDDTILGLEKDASRHLADHYRFARSRDHKSNAGSTDWKQRAQTDLFRSKRSKALAEILTIRRVIVAAASQPTAHARLGELLSQRAGRQAVARLIRKARTDRVGTAIADITVCGAVAPYNELLGGKLVSLLAASPATVALYRQRYERAASEIASAIAGREVIRPSDLVFLGTTSLYGSGSSQYNRIRVPAERLGGEDGDELRFRELGYSRSFGTSHLGAETVDALVALVEHAGRGRRVNSIFGEGVSPKLRKVRAGLDELGWPSDELLRHGRRRIVYGVPLIRNLRAYLLGMERRPKYIVPLTPEAIERLSSYWVERWLAKRSQSEEVLLRIVQHDHRWPIRHGARVQPPTSVDPQLF